MNRSTLLLVAPLLLSLAVACDKSNQTDTTHTTGGTVPAGATPSSNDNTGLNARDNGSALTPFDQSNRQADLDTTQDIRKALIADDSLSADAKNVKIITNDGIVTLRGPVKDDGERARVELMARKAAETDRIVNELDAPAK